MPLTRAWMLEAADRALKSAAQAVILLWSATKIDAFTLDWKVAAGAALGAASLSVLTSVVSMPFGDPGNASFLPVTRGRHEEG